MRKLIKSTDDLPKIFDINKYNDMDKLSAFEWYFLIQSRYLLHAMLDKPNPFFVGENLIDEEIEEAVQLAIETHLNFPLMLDLSINYTKKNNETITILISNSSHYSFMKKHLPVNELDIDEFQSLQRMIEFSGKALKRSLDDENNQSIMDLLSSRFGHNVGQCDYPITINPYYPDHVIIEEFKKLLIKIRQNVGFNEKNRSISKKDLLNWASYKLLPYMDLKILEIFEGIKITNSVICSILYQKGEYGEDTLRKSVEPIRKKILEQLVFDSADDVQELSILDALSYLAYEDIKNMEKF